MPQPSGEELVRMQRDARRRGLRAFPDWAVMTRQQRRGLLFVLRSNGETLESVAAACGLSREYVRTVLKVVDRQMQRQADRGFH